MVASLWIIVILSAVVWIHNGSIGEAYCGGFVGMKGLTALTRPRMMTKVDPTMQPKLGVNSTQLLGRPDESKAVPRFRLWNGWLPWKNSTDRYIMKSMVHLDKIMESAHENSPNGEDAMSSIQLLAIGAFSRTVSQGLIHPLNALKTVLQLRRNSHASMAKTYILSTNLLQGIDAQLLLSLPHGALYYYFIQKLKPALQERQVILLKQINKEFLNDFVASTVATILCSVISTPQMVLTDRMAASEFSSSAVALRSILKSEGIAGLYRGWWPALLQKIPSYGLTWMFYQQLKRLQKSVASGKGPKSHMLTYWTKGINVTSKYVDLCIGALASSAAVCLMNPLDTIKTRLVTQIELPTQLHSALAGEGGSPYMYDGMWHCAKSILAEEGIGAFYKSLPPRLLSVVPMMAVQVTTGYRITFGGVHLGLFAQLYCMEAAKSYFIAQNKKKS
jgi:hypothetical protein